ALGDPQPGQVQLGQVLLVARLGVARLGAAVEGVAVFDELAPQPPAGVVVERAVGADRHAGRSPALGGCGAAGLYVRHMLMFTPQSAAATAERARRPGDEGGSVDLAYLREHPQHVP